MCLSFITSHKRKAFFQIRITKMLKKCLCKLPTKKSIFVCFVLAFSPLYGERKVPNFPSLIPLLITVVRRHRTSFPLYILPQTHLLSPWVLSVLLLGGHCSILPFLLPFLPLLSSSLKRVSRRRESSFLSPALGGMFQRRERERQRERERGKRKRRRRKQQKRNWSEERAGRSQKKSFFYLRT